MVNIILIVLGICLIIGIIQSLKDYILGFIGLAAIVAAVIFLGPPIWAFVQPLLLTAWSFIWSFLRSVPSYILSLFKWILPFLPYLLGAILILSLGIYIYNRIKYGTKISELDKLGIEAVTHFAQDAGVLERIGGAKIIGDGYIISSKFYRDITYSTNQSRALSQNEIRDYCFRYASKFQAVFLLPLLSYLNQKKELFPFPGADCADYYLSGGFVKECKELFEKEGATTRRELIQIFESSPVTRVLQQESSRLAAFVLDQLISDGEAEKVKLSESGDHLYVTKSWHSDSKLIRHEISMD